jgi:hypothetical protein
MTAHMFREIRGCIDYEPFDENDTFPWAGLEVFVQFVEIPYVTWPCFRA